MIFTTILSVVLVSAAAFTTRLVYNLRINEHKLLANVYASEMLEWLSSEREANWPALLGKAATGAGQVYCFNGNITGTTTFPASAGSCTLFNGITSRPPLMFKREVRLARNAAGNQITATVRVSWQESSSAGPVTYFDEIQAIYTSW